MGLRCDIDLNVNLGLPKGGEPIVSEKGNPGEMFTPNYTPGAQAFASAFMRHISVTCPYLTGYLYSTISGDAGGFQISVWADAEYAQYLEYGTWKMEAQPYFEESILEGIHAATTQWRNAVQQAYQDSKKYADLEAELFEGDPLTAMMAEGQMMQIELMYADYTSGIDNVEFVLGESHRSGANGTDYGSTDNAQRMGEAVGQYAMASAWENGASWLGGTGAGLAVGGLTFLLLAPLDEATSYTGGLSKGEEYGFDLAEQIASSAMIDAWASSGSQVVGTLAGMAVGALLGPLFATLFDGLIGDDFSSDGGVLSDHLSSFTPNIEIT